MKDDHCDICGEDELSVTPLNHNFQAMLERILDIQISPHLPPVWICVACVSQLIERDADLRVSSGQELSLIDVDSVPKCAELFPTRPPITKEQVSFLQNSPSPPPPTSTEWDITKILTPEIMLKISEENFETSPPTKPIPKLEPFKFQCNNCTKIFPTKDLLETHVINKHLKIQPYQCKVCKIYFYQKDELENHLKPNIHQCNFCCQGFESEKSFQKHVSLMHWNLRTEPKILIEGEVECIKNKIQCEICKKLFSYKDALRRHLVLHLPNPPKFPCFACGKVLSRKDKLRQHLINSHNVKMETIKVEKILDVQMEEILNIQMEEMSNENKEKVECDICQKFMSKRALKRHKLNIHQPNPPKFPCDVCGAVLTRVDKLHEHLKTIHNVESKILNENKVHCDVCNKIISKNSLKRHKLIHQPNQPKYLCIVCGKVFGRKDRLLGHLRAHTKQQNLVCRICGVEYKCKQNLNRHMLAHETNMPMYKCEACSFMFISKSLERAHFNAVHKQVAVDE